MEQFKRFETIIGKENMRKINKTSVLILGLGGVGSYALEALVRSGIEKITIVDNDIIDITNLNRQLMSLHTNIGKSKVDVWEERIKNINPNCEITKINQFITPLNIDILFQNKIHYIIDACDTIETKKEIIRQSVNRKIKMISSMGTGNKLDPTKLEILDIRKTSYDPIARIIRKMVKDEKIDKKIPVVCSSEKVIKNDSKIIGSTAFVPATAGLLCASFVINDIIGDINDRRN